MNPPYGVNSSGSSAHLHLEFTEKCLEISNNVVSIFPDRIITSSSNKYDKYKEKFNDRLYDIEQINSNETFNTATPPVGIFTFGKDKTNTIKVKWLNGDEEEYNSMNDFGSNFNKYEQQIFNYCKNDKPNFNPFRPLGKDKKEKLSEFCDLYINRRWPKDNKIFLITNLANGGMNGSFISNSVGQICENNEKLKEEMIKRKGACCTIMTFDSIISAQNCKEALKRPLMRLFLYRLQDDQSMTARVYVGIPNINWEDERTKTDNGILEMCGCSKDKAKEYAEYCAKVVKNEIEDKYSNKSRRAKNV